MEYKVGQNVNHDGFIAELCEYIGGYYWRCWCLNEYCILHEDDFKKEREVKSAHDKTR